ncbi:MAG: DUF4145 domain-containing protein [Spirochaetaceae bacterium]|jgi:mRNA-degrading endonuclease YafQ of YafQ-DinJ toxin-antitoxin module|nr:DUF4145 domain-containing protein [Spirochaetaceae bacterium]
MVNEETFTEEIECPLCKNQVNMKIMKDITLEQLTYNDIAPFDNITNDLHWEVLKCPACSKFILREGWWNELRDVETGPDFKIIYPTSQDKKILGLPIKIEQAYKAAENVRMLDNNAFAVLLGRVLDQILIDKEAIGDNLYEKLNNLASRDLLPKTIVDAAHGIRKLRNIGAHADLGELSEQEIPILEDITNIILEYLYVVPKMVLQMQDRIELLKKK